jgi:hypothetical protein
MKNGTINVCPTRISLDQVIASVDGTPIWWATADEVDRNAAAKGCLEPERDCIECRVDCCPEARRMCRVCAEWQSNCGVSGMCDRIGLMQTRDHTCEHWRART